MSGPLYRPLGLGNADWARLKARAREARARERTDRWYRGVLIQVASPNSSGIRWFARLEDGRVLRADTLQGIKHLITESVTR